MEDTPDGFEVEKLPDIETEEFRVDTPSPLLEYDFKQSISVNGVDLQKKLDILKFVNEHENAYLRGVFGKNADTGEIEWVTIDLLYFGGDLTREELLDFIELTEGISESRVIERAKGGDYCSLEINFN